MIAAMPYIITGTIIGSYVLTSLLLFKFPNLVHKKKRLKFRCVHISHRGGAGENIENTLTAFKHAVSQGTDMLEIDLQLTKDGEVVVSHDHNLLRSTGINEDVSKLNYHDLPLLRQDMPIDFDSGQQCKGGDDRQIPLLREVFERFPQVAINIDVKNDNDELIRKVSKLIKEYNREDTTVWGTFSNTVTKKCYKENPNIPILFSAASIAKLVLLTYSGLLPFIPLKESCLETLMPSVFLRRDLEFLQKRKWLRVALWITEKLLIRKALFNHLSKRGIQTYLWVLNSEADYEKAYKAGATGVMTDYPTRLRNFLDSHPKYQN